MSDVRWAVRVGERWLCTNGLYKEKNARATFSDRLFAIHAQGCVNRDDSRIVKITRKPKAKTATRDEWTGTVYEFDSHRFHIRHADNTGSSAARFDGWLNDNAGKRVRVTLEVLES